MRFPFRSPNALAPAVGAVVAVVLLGLGAPAAVQGQVRRDTTRAPARQPAQRAQAEQAERPTAEMQQQMEVMGPMMGQMMQAMMQGMLTVLSKPETAQQMATFTRNYRDALMARGFSREDALRIVMAHGLPMMPAGR